jgi:O-antigen/teichoic acid export membrane protein
VVAVAPYLATFALAIACTWVAARRVQPNFHGAVRDVPRVRTVRGGRVLDVAWPMLLQMIALPIAMQTDRIVLSHLSTPRSLAQYNLASQLYSPVWQITSAAGIALWPIFARARARSTRSAAGPLQLAAAFAGIAALLCAVITAVAPWLAARASGDRVHLGPLLLVSFAVFMIFQAAKYPLGMYLTDARGLRFQALTIAAFLPVNLGLSIVLARPYGAAGPVIGSAVGVLLCQVVANWLYVRRIEAAAESRPREADSSPKEEES